MTTTFPHTTTFQCKSPDSTTPRTDSREAPSRVPDIFHGAINPANESTHNKKTTMTRAEVFFVIHLALREAKEAGLKKDYPIDVDRIEMLQLFQKARKK